MADVAQDVFTKHDISVELIDTRTTGVNCITAVITGEVDMCSAGTTLGTAAVGQGANLQVVGVTQALIFDVYLSQAAVTKTGVSPKAPVEERVRAMKGLNVVTGPLASPYGVIFGDILKTEGMSMSDVHYRMLNDQVAMKEGLRNGTFEIVAWFSGAFADLEKDSVITNWISIPRGDMPRYTGVPFITVFTSKNYSDHHADVMSRMHAALADANAALKAEPAKYSALIKAKFYPDMSDVLWDGAFKVGVSALADSAKATKENWNFFMDLQRAATPEMKYPERLDYEQIMSPAAK
jgi:NitT/TauT family transport system substrate-binding protein